MVMQNYQLQEHLFAAAFKKEAHKNFAIFARPVIFIKKRLQHRCFPVNIAKFIRTDFVIEHLRWLLLQLVIPAIILLFKFGKFALIEMDLQYFLKVTLFYDDVFSIIPTIPNLIGVCCKSSCQNLVKIFLLYREWQHLIKVTGSYVGDIISNV